MLVIISGYAGTKAGLRLLGRIPEKQFKFWFKWLLSRCCRVMQKEKLAV